MTQNPQTAPAGWYPSPDGAPVLRWWDGTMWTHHTHEPAPPAPTAPTPVAPTASVPAAESPPSGPAASGWPAPEPPRIARLAMFTRVLVAFTGVAIPLVVGAQLWRRADPPAWLSEYVVEVATGVTGALFVLSAVAWLLWQNRVAATFPPGTPRRTPGWHVLSWLIPVGAWWLPFQNVGDLFTLTTGRRPTWLIGWWVLWVGGTIVGAFAVVQPWLGLVGALLLAAAAPLAWLIVRQLTHAISPQSGTPRRAQALAQHEG